MRGVLPNGLWMLGVAFAAIGLLRSVVMVQAPQAGTLPESLRSGLQLPGYRVLPRPGAGLERGRDVAWGQSVRYLLVPPKGSPMHLELVVRRGRSWHELALPELAKVRSLRLAANQQIQLGEEGGKQTLRTCVVGRGEGATEPEAQVDVRGLNDAVKRWRHRLDPADAPLEVFWRLVAIQAGLRVSERWECLMVTLMRSDHGLGPWRRADPDGHEQLIQTWHDLYVRLKSWGEHWDGVGY